MKPDLRVFALGVTHREPIHCVEIAVAYGNYEIQSQVILREHDDSEIEIELNAYLCGWLGRHLNINDDYTKAVEVIHNVVMGVVLGTEKHEPHKEMN